ncbi:MAG: leucine-rich repeat domain-containing protein [Bacteroidaceae bacterium]|nr:leucine-rich repeat domain-containing protein [Bacteroidaceae bacterium]
MDKNIFVCLLAVLLPFLASAHDFEVDGIYYNITSEEKKTVEVTALSDKKIVDGGYKFYKDVVFIPEKVNYVGKEYTVTAVGESAFACNDELLSVVMPNSIVSIGKFAFSACLKLKSLTIPRNVNEIGDFAFTLMPSLEHLVVDESNNTFDSREGCNAIIRTRTNTLCVGCKKTVIPDGVEVIARNAFTACSAEPGDLEPFEINIPESVEIIDAYAFNGCGSLVAVKFSEGLKRIDRWAFLGTSIESIEIPASVTVINEAFWGCSSLKEIKVKKGNRDYDSRKGCNAIIESATGCLLQGCENTTVPDGVKVISSSAFYRSKIKKIKLPSSLETIERGAFAECKELKKLVIPGSVKIIELEILCGSGIEELIVENGVEEISDYAFFECRKLRYVSLPASLKMLGPDGAVFVDCPELVRVDVDKDNEYYCSNGQVIVNKRTMTIVDGWGTESCNAADFSKELLPTRIGNNAFRKQSLLRLAILPTTIEEIGDGAFSDCKNLRRVNCHATVPPVLGKDAFKLNAINGKEFTPLQETLILLVPETSVEAYKNAPGWKEFKNIISIR